jgi:transposase
MVFAVVMKVYGTLSGRRSISDLRDMKKRGMVTAHPHYSTLFAYLEDPALTPLLTKLIEESALPLRSIERNFAADSSGFSTCVYRRWFDIKYGKMKTEHEWLKAHIMVGVATHVVTAVQVTDAHVHDCPQFMPLLASTAQRFHIDDMLGDKAYLSNDNLAATVAVGAMPYIPFKSNSRDRGPELWRRLFHFYQFQRETFLAHYHQRSNVESAFSMIKAKFGAALRSKSRVAQENEILCKLLAHNLCRLVHSIYELGIEPTFWERRLDA